MPDIVWNPSPRSRDSSKAFCHCSRGLLTRPLLPVPIRNLHPCSTAPRPAANTQPSRRAIGADCARPMSTRDRPPMKLRARATTDRERPSPSRHGSGCGPRRRDPMPAIRRPRSTARPPRIPHGRPPRNRDRVAATPPPSAADAHAVRATAHFACRTRSRRRRSGSVAASPRPQCASDQSGVRPMTGWAVRKRRSNASS